MDPRAFVYMALSGEEKMMRNGVVDGVVVVDSECGRALCTQIDDLEPEGVRVHIREQIKNVPENLYILHKTKEHLHVFSYPRERALSELKSGTLPLAQ